MSSICGINCEKCNYKENCCGCEETCGKPFGGDCIAAEYIKVGGKKAYLQFKINLLKKINDLLIQNGLPISQNLYELNGAFVNLEYDLPNGEKVKFLDDKKIYLGCQIEVEGLEMCYGIVADANFILISRYYKNGTNPQLVIYKCG